MTAGGSSMPEVQRLLSVFRLLERGGLLVMDDLTPDWPGFDPVRAWAHGHSGLMAVEVLTTPETSALLVARI